MAEVLRQTPVTAYESVSNSLLESLAAVVGGAIPRESGSKRRSTSAITRPTPLDNETPGNVHQNERRGPERQRTFRILVVDDNKDAATTLGLMLQHIGHETALAFDGIDAIERSDEFHPDIVLLDIGLPGLSGYGVAHCLRERSESQCPVLIALTGRGEDDDKRRSAEAGFAVHLVKPVGLATLGSLLAGIDTVQGGEA